MRKLRPLLTVAVVAVLIPLIPLPALARSLPRTLADSERLGRLDGIGHVVDASFRVEYLGVSWRSGRLPLVRFRVCGRWTRWAGVRVDDDLPSLDGRTYSPLVAADGADAYQLKGSAHGVRAVAINTTDGPRSWTVTSGTSDAQASLTQPPVISRLQWGADESYRFNPDGSEIWPPAFYPTQKLIVHHTASSNDEQDWAARVRAIYYYHAVTRGWGDIGYNFLVDPQGNIYKGRWSGPPGTRDQSLDTLTGENAQGFGVTGAHVSGYNSGTMGITVLGTYSTVGISSTARSALVDHLAWESEHHGLDPLASSTYTNPVSGAQKIAPNISGHRDWAATECPGDMLYSELPFIQQAVATKLSGPTPPGAPTLSAAAGNAMVHLTWIAASDGGSPITNYNIYRDTTSGGATLVAMVGNVTSYDDTGLTNGSTYYYQVSAITAVGEGVRSNEVSATPQAATVPGAPTLTAKSAKGAKARGVVLSWTVPSDGGSGITGYRIYQSTSSGTEAFLVEVGNVTSYKDTATTRGITYFYRVGAVNAVGEGPLSNEASAKAT